MIQLHDHYLVRNGVKIGWIVGNKLYGHDGKEVGYVSGETIYDRLGKKLAYLQGEYVYNHSDGERMRCEDIIKDIEAGMLPDVMRVAIKFFFGD